jgi:hypothetical protein
VLLLYAHHITDDEGVFQIKKTFTFVALLCWSLYSLSHYCMPPIGLRFISSIGTRTGTDVRLLSVHVDILCLLASIKFICALASLIRMFGLGGLVEGFI